MKQITEELRTYRTFPVTYTDLYTAHLVPLGVPEADYRIAFGAQFDLSGEYGEFWTIERREGDYWRDAVPHFESHYVAAYKGRIEQSRYLEELREFIQRRCPQFEQYLREDLAAIQKVLDENESL